ncbi:MAG: hypothetical protein LIQ30_11380, partial [Planctomycetes bacterium]|nr:hypothetical protein [Planctomycetota bacterium]
MDYAAIQANFEKHGFTTRLFSSADEARNFFVETLDKQTIGFGGSITLKELGLFEALSEPNPVVCHNLNGHALDDRRLS